MPSEVNTNLQYFDLKLKKKKRKRLSTILSFTTKQQIYLFIWDVQVAQRLSTEKIELAVQTPAEDVAFMLHSCPWEKHEAIFFLSPPRYTLDWNF